jgi:hypothetical protein
MAQFGHHVEIQLDKIDNNQNSISYLFQIFKRNLI